jgi:NAD-dependent DNA ligase
LENKLLEPVSGYEIGVIDTSHPLYKKNIVMTGFRDEELANKLKKIGANVSGSVSKNTFVVLAKNKDDDTGKASEARKLNIPIVTPLEFKSQYLI